MRVRHIVFVSHGSSKKQLAIMSQRWYAKCSVVGCKKPHSSLHRLPVSEEQKLQWINFIYDGSVPTTLGKSLFVCANHFTKECLSNWGQYISGHAVRLILKDGSIPTFRGYADEENVSILGFNRRMVRM